MGMKVLGMLSYFTLYPTSTNNSFFTFFFSKSALMFSKAVAELDQIVMGMVAKSYGIEQHYKSLFGSTTYLLRFIKYLCPQGNGQNLGLVPHTDKSFMSILHQKQVKGLEIKTKDGQWIEVDPSPSSFIVMAGDACMVGSILTS